MIEGGGHALQYIAVIISLKFIISISLILLQLSGKKKIITFTSLDSLKCVVVEIRKCSLLEMTVNM